MFESIQRSLGDAFKKLRGRGRLTETNIRDGLQEVRRAFLDAAPLPARLDPIAGWGCGNVRA